MEDKEIYRLFIMYRVFNDEEALNKLAEQFIGLVFNYAANNFKQLELEERVSLCLYSLTRSLSKFDPEKGFKFSTYATICMKNKIMQYIDRKYENKENIISLDYSITNENGKQSEYINCLSNKVNIEEDYLKKESIIELYAAIKKLEKKEEMLIRMFYGLGCKKYTQQELAKIFNYSQSAISKKIVNIQKKIRIKMESEDCLINKCR